MDQSQAAGGLEDAGGEYPNPSDVIATRARRAAALAPGTRLLAVFAIACLVLAGGLFARQAADQRLIAATADRLDGGLPSSPEQTLVRDVAFATHELSNPPDNAGRPLLVRWYYRLNPLHPGAGDVLRWGSDYRGPCGSHTNVVIALLAERSIRSRPLLLRNPRGRVVHTVVEALIGGRWVVADPTFGIVYRRSDGALATREDIVADPARFDATVRAIADYVPEFRYEAATLMNWNKIPVLLPGIKAVLDATLGVRRVDGIAKPLLWLRPEEAYGALAMGCAVLLAALALTRSRPARTVTAPPGPAFPGRQGREAEGLSK